MEKDKLEHTSTLLGLDQYESKEVMLRMARLCDEHGYLSANRFNKLNRPKGWEAR